MRQKTIVGGLFCRRRRFVQTEGAGVERWERVCENCVFCQERTGFLRTRLECMGPGRLKGSTVLAKDPACEVFRMTPKASFGLFGERRLSQAWPLAGTDASHARAPAMDESLDEIDVLELKAQAAEARAAAAEARAAVAEARLRRGEAKGNVGH